MGETAAEIGGELRQMAGVFLDALVRIDAVVARESKQIGVLRSQPFVEQIARQPGSELDLRDLREPGLSNDKAQQSGDDHQEHDDLMQEVAEIVALQGIVEGALPGVQPHLSGRDGSDDKRCQHRK